jgi:hypothetical protein
VTTCPAISTRHSQCLFNEHVFTSFLTGRSPISPFIQRDFSRHYTCRTRPSGTSRPNNTFEVERPFFFSSISNEVKFAKIVSMIFKKTNSSCPDDRGHCCHLHARSKRLLLLERYSGHICDRRSHSPHTPCPGNWFKSCDDRRNRR